MLNAISYKVPIITMRCDQCEGVKDFKTSELRNEIRRGGRPGASVDYQTGVGTYPQCGACVKTARGKALIRRLTRRKGRAALVAGGQRLAALRTPEQQAEAGRKAHAARRGTHLTGQQKLNIASGEMQPRLAERLDACRVCRGITCTERHRGQKRLGQTHLICLQQYQRKHQGSRVGRTVRAAYPPPPKGRPLSSEYLASSYEICVRHLIRGETIGKAALDGGTGLAAEFGLERRSIRDRIKAFLKRLPTDGIGGKRLAHRADILLRAATKYGYKI